MGHDGLPHCQAREWPPGGVCPGPGRSTQDEAEALQALSPAHLVLGAWEALAQGNLKLCAHDQGARLEGTLSTPPSPRQQLKALAALSSARACAQPVAQVGLTPRPLELEEAAGAQEGPPASRVPPPTPGRRAHPLQESRAGPAPRNSQRFPPAPATQQPGPQAPGRHSLLGVGGPASASIKSHGEPGVTGTRGWAVFQGPPQTCSCQQQVTSPNSQEARGEGSSPAPQTGKPRRRRAGCPPESPGLRSPPPRLQRGMSQASGGLSDGLPSLTGPRGRCCHPRLKGERRQASRVKRDSRIPLIKASFAQTWAGAHGVSSKAPQSPSCSWRGN